MWLVMRSSRRWVTLEQARTGEILIVRMTDGATLYAMGDDALAVKEAFGATWVGLDPKSARRQPWEAMCAEYLPDGPITPAQAEDRDGLPPSVLATLRLNRQIFNLPVPRWLNQMIKEQNNA